MNPDKNKHFLELLLSIRNDVLKRVKLGECSESEEEEFEAAGEHGFSDHMADQGSQNMHQEDRFRFRERDSELLHEIDLAIDKIESGDFGLCELCKDEITEQRLEYMPYVRFCMFCKAKLENIKNKINKDKYIQYYKDEELEEFQEELL